MPEVGRKLYVVQLRAYGLATANETKSSAYRKYLNNQMIAFTQDKKLPRAHHKNI